MIVASLGVSSPERTGDWFYRTAQPLHTMAQCEGIWSVELVQVHRAKKLVCDRADVMVVNMVWDDDLQDAVASRRARGQVTVLEFNDDLSEMSGATRDDLARHARMLLAMPLVDGVQFSSPALARRYGRWCRQHVVLPNQIAHSMVEEPPPEKRDGRFTVGWGGSVRHRDDLATVMPALTSWMRVHPRSALRVMGDASVFLPLLPNTVSTLVQPGPIDAYYRFIAGLDVGIAPLNLTQYSRCRTDLKWLEYAAHGVVPVVQDLDPYQHASPCLRFTSPEELCDHLSWLHDHPEERQRLAARAQAASRARDHHLGAIQRLQFYRELLPWGRDTQGDGLISALRQYDGHSIEGRYVNMWFGAHEQAEWRRIDKLAQQSAKVARPRQDDTGLPRWHTESARTTQR